MRAELIGHFETCVTDIYLHILCAHGRLYSHAPVVCELLADSDPKESHEVLHASDDWHRRKTDRHELWRGKVEVDHRARDIADIFQDFHGLIEGDVGHLPTVAIQSLLQHAGLLFVKVAHVLA